MMADLCEFFVTLERESAGTTARLTQSQLSYRDSISIDRNDCNVATLQRSGLL